MEVRHYKQGDEDAILELFRLSFGKELSKEVWSWRYDNNPFYDKKIISLMWDGEVLAGHYAISPVEIKHNGNIYLTALSMTTMTHPSYRGKGIFPILAKSVYDKAFNNHSVSLIWGFPNNNSHYGFVKKLNWADYLHIPMLSLSNFDRLGAVQIEGFEIDDFSNWNLEAKITSSSGYMGINKTSRYMNWRFIENPTTKYAAFSLGKDSGEFLIYKKYINTSSQNKEVDIVDFNIIPDKNTTFQYINQLLARLQGEKIEKVNIWVPLNSLNYQFFELIGFTPGEPVTYFGGLENPKRNSGLQPSNWSFSMCYSDVF